MKAVITKPFRCAPNGAIVEDFEPGQEVSGKVADWAVSAGFADEIGEAPEVAKAPAPEVTKPKKRGRKKKSAKADD